MSFVHGSAARIYVAGFDLSAFLKNVSTSVSVEALDSTTFGATTKAYIAGLEDATINMDGLFSGAIGATDAVLHAALRSAVPGVWNWLPSGDVDGAFGYGLSVVETSYDIESPVDDLVSVTAEAQSNVGLERVQILAPLAARIATGNGMSRDSAVSTTAGGVAYLQVASVTGGTPNLVVRIQHSVDAVAWVDLITFAAVTASNAAQRIAVTGTVNRHVRAHWTITGGTPSFTLFAAFGRL